jgi:hypothetical protein
MCHRFQGTSGPSVILPCPLRPENARLLEIGGNTWPSVCGSQLKTQGRLRRMVLRCAWQIRLDYITLHYIRCEMTMIPGNKKESQHVHTHSLIMYIFYLQRLSRLFPFHDCKMCGRRANELALHCVCSYVLYFKQDLVGVTCIVCARACFILSMI